MKLQKSQGRYTISVPKEYVLLKKWKKGQLLAFLVNDHGDLILREVK